MKSVVLWAFLLGVVSCVVYDDESKCAANTTSVKFTLKSYRNQTGHWKAQVQLEHSSVEKDGAAWEVDIEHTYAPRCDGSGAVLVEATLTVPPKGNAVANQQPDKSIPAGYRKLSERHYFSFKSKPAVWLDAGDICENEGAHLAVINSEAEAKFMASLWNSTSEWTFIGIHDRYVEGKYVTIYNQTLSDAGYNKWDSGEPNGKTAENCGFIVRNAMLGDISCSRPLPYICELEY